VWSDELSFVDLGVVGDTFESRRQSQYNACTGVTFPEAIAFHTRQVWTEQSAVLLETSQAARNCNERLYNTLCTTIRLKLLLSLPDRERLGGNQPGLVKPKENASSNIVHANGMMRQHNLLRAFKNEAHQGLMAGLLIHFVSKANHSLQHET
jgi:hypothetical protein